jgi:DNA-binding GntR family transcriptional regulator
VKETEPTVPRILSERLRREILSGKLKAGQALVQEDLADRYSVSRIPVREALRQLEAEGLVQYLPRRGAVVAAASAAEVSEMFDIRVALECRALALAVPNMSEADFEAARTVLDAYGHEPNPARWGEINWRFHWTLYAPCERPKLLALIEQNYGNVGRFLRTQVSAATGRDKPHREHYEILQACVEQNATRAVKILERHIVAAQKAVAAAFRQAQAAG